MFWNLQESDEVLDNQTIIFWKSKSKAKNKERAQQDAAATRNPLQTASTLS